ncbi:hypothetical protein MMC13_005200 [Lambiella insularis]|nr:hypothetical protein [Lambiella insularis]
MESSTSPPPTPRIRLNSAHDNLLTQGSNNNWPISSTRPEPPGGRSLIPSRPTIASTVHKESAPRRLQEASPHESAELLLPPSKSRTHRFRDDDPSARGSPDTNGFRSPLASGFSSRRTSWSSEAGSRDSRIYGQNPFDDSRAPSRAASDDDNVNTQTVSEKYNISPSAGLLLFPEDVEKDDYLHNPDPNEKEAEGCDIFTKRGFLNIGGLAFITIGVLILFIGFPVLTFVRKVTNPPDICATDPNCIDIKQPILKNIRSSLIDPDTPSSAHTKTSVDGSQLKLVFSDEFNKDGRTFYPGDDPYFTAVDIWYGVTQDLEWYDPDAVTTKDGALEIRFDAFQNHGLNYRSGMVQSWNQLCFQGGHLEASISLPGRGDTVGFWPGFWAMGNLGRPGYAATTDGMWPYSYDNVCDAGITKNQSQTDGINMLPGMRLPACTCAGEDHPTPGTSRSAPEIDVIEASVAHMNANDQIGVVSQSAQMAPFDIWYAPDTDYMAVYNPEITTLNGYRGGPYQQAMSALSTVNNNWYAGKGYQTYAFEYVPGSSGKINWFVGNESTWMMDARSIRPNGNVGQRVIPKEPMAMIMNFGMSNSFSALNLTGIAPLLPATMRFDYVRIYQDSGSVSVTCNPTGYETTGYIEEHPDAYNNPNLTQWSHTTGTWPKNALVDGCQAEVSVPITTS